jgi:hypothetical protein
MVAFTPSFSLSLASRDPFSRSSLFSSELKPRDG